MTKGGTLPGEKVGGGGHTPPPFSNVSVFTVLTP